MQLRHRSPETNQEREIRQGTEQTKAACHNLAITEHGGDAAALLRKAADAIEQLGDIEILDGTYRASAQHD
jgi:hypothetical protein